MVINGKGPADPSTLTCREVDIGKQNDVSGDQRDELSDADLFFEVDMHHVVLP